MLVQVPIFQLEGAQKLIGSGTAVMVIWLGLTHTGRRWPVTGERGRAQNPTTAGEFSVSVAQAEMDNAWSVSVPSKLYFRWLKRIEQSA